MRLFFFITILIINVIQIEANKLNYTNHEGLSRLDSIVTTNGHYNNLIKEEFLYDYNSAISQAKGFTWIDNNWSHTHTINYTYDNNGNLLSETKISIASPDHIQHRNIFTYDSDNNFLSEEFYITNSSNQLIGLGKYSYIYNSDRTIKKVTSSIWDVKTSTWIEDYSYAYEYDQNQNQRQIIILRKNPITKQWENSLKTDYIFNVENILTEETHYKGSLNTWIKASKKTIELNNNLINQIIIYAGDENNRWTNSNKYIYTYQDTGISTISEFLWDGISWVDYSKEEHTYLNGKPSFIKYNLKEDDGSWSIYSEKMFANNPNSSSYEQYIYDTKGNKLGLQKEIILANDETRIEENFSWENGAWISQSKNRINLNAENQVNLIEKSTQGKPYYRAEFEYLSDTRMFTEDIFDWYQDQWALGKRVQYFYADTISSIDIESISSDQLIKILTSQDLITINCDEPIKNVKIYTVTGKLIYNGSDSQINTSSWDKTAYIVSVITRSNQYRTTKVLVL